MSGAANGSTEHGLWGDMSGPPVEADLEVLLDSLSPEELDGRVTPPRGQRAEPQASVRQGAVREITPQLTEARRPSRRRYYLNWMVFWTVVLSSAAIGLGFLLATAAGDLAVWGGIGTGFFLGIGLNAFIGAWKAARRDSGE